MKKDFHMLEFPLPRGLISQNLTFLFIVRGVSLLSYLGSRYGVLFIALSNYCFMNMLDYVMEIVLSVVKICYQIERNLELVVTYQGKILL